MLEGLWRAGSFGAPLETTWIEGDAPGLRNEGQYQIRFRTGGLWNGPESVGGVLHSSSVVEPENQGSI